MTHSSSMNDCVQKIISITDRLFGVTKNAVNPTAVQKALIDFDDVFHGSIEALRETRRRPLAKTFADHVTKRLKGQFNSLSPTAEEVARFDTLSRAFLAIAQGLDYNAAIKNEPPYHNRSHNMLVCAVLLATQRTKMGPIATTKDLTSLMQLLVAGLAHDFGHDGTTNTMHGVYEPGRLEMASIAQISPLLRKAGLSDNDRLYINDLILVTDPRLPADIVKSAYGRNHPGTRFCYINTPNTIIMEMKKTTNLVTDLALQHILDTVNRNEDFYNDALAIQSADLVPSFGLSAQKCDSMSFLFAKEMNPSATFPEFSRRVGTRLRTSALSLYSIMLSLLGMEFRTTEPVAAPNDGSGLSAQDIEMRQLLTKFNLYFLDPTTQQLFGDQLYEIRKICLKQIPSEHQRREQAQKNKLYGRLSGVWRNRLAILRRQNPQP